MANWDKIKANAERIAQAIEAAGNGVQAHSASVNTLYKLFFDAIESIDYAGKGNAERLDDYAVILKAVEAVIRERNDEFDAADFLLWGKLKNRYFIRHETLNHIIKWGEFAKFNKAQSA